ncbi:MAG: manganese efflux pump MntP family protein [Lachnospiraceae bacterium]|nr:manganese efflux pump MntP family protein [Lachnospiraceae bacterium]MCI1424543.1 manganese efflux pump MntP family protein [Lachnospiraceae bacterium]MCI1453298.1 manganese efflux pump MntP family protein [Lachnospiraceae bacterium]
MNTWFFLNSILLGVGLAMDAFSVSIANGLSEHGMTKRRMSAIAGCYGLFQWAMPMIGWFCVHTISGLFSAFQKFIPWIALFLLLCIGGKMLLEGIRKKSSEELEEEEKADAGTRISTGTLLVQGVATSIDALSVGFTIADYNAPEAFVCSLLIAVVTFGICMVGLLFGRKFGEKLADKAGIFGGIILIAIGVEIFVRGFFGI